MCYFKYLFFYFQGSETLRAHQAAAEPQISMVRAPSRLHPPKENYRLPLSRV